MSESLIPEVSGGIEETESQEVEAQTEDEGVESEIAESEGAGFLYADGVVGKGEPPEWFKANKYKTVEDQAKAYTELEKRFGAFSGAPKEDYEIEGVEFEDNPLLQTVAEWGKENQLSNEGLTGLVTKVNELAQKQIEEDRIAAMEALGEDAEKRLQSLAEWGKNNLTPEEFEQFKGLAQTAGQVAVMEKLIGMTKNSKLAHQTVTKQTAGVDEEELKKMYLATNEKGQRLMDVDMAYRKKVNKLYYEFYNTK